MDHLKLIKYELENSSTNNHLYFCLEEPELKKIKEWVKEEHGFHDFVLDLSDHFRLQGLIDSIPTGLNRGMIESWISREYLCYKLLEKGNLYETEKETLTNWKISDKVTTEEALFGTDFEKFVQLQSIDLSMVIALFQQQKKKTGKTPRVHVFYDEFTNPLLERTLNDLMGMRSLLAYRGYSSRENLSTYLTKHGTWLEEVHDITSFYPENYYKQKRKKWDSILYGVEEEK